MRKSKNVGTVSLALLLDTQILVWAGNGNARLPPSIRLIIAQAENDLLVSAVTAFEFSDLELRGRFPSGVVFDDLVRRFSLTIVDFPGQAWTLVRTLPEIHRDPVDRMLIAHAIHDGHTLVTADANIRRYPVKTLW